MSTNRLDVLRAMSPQVSLDDVWSREEQNTVLLGILAADRSAAVLAPPHRRRTPAIVAALALGVAAAPGVAYAVGNGMAPRSFIEAYSDLYDYTDGAIDPATAQRVATVPGPDGGTLSILTIKNADGSTCLTPVYETAGSSTSALPDNFEGLATLCEGVPSSRPFGSAALDVNESAATWWVDAGDAVKGEVTMPTGETYPVAYAEGYLFGWYPLPARFGDDAPTLTAFDADGSLVGKIRLG